MKYTVKDSPVVTVQGVEYGIFEFPQSGSTPLFGIGPSAEDALHSLKFKKYEDAVEAIDQLPIQDKAKAAGQRQAKAWTDEGNGEGTGYPKDTDNYHSETESKVI